jgi:YacP-like NYN domain
MPARRRRTTSSNAGAPGAGFGAARAGATPVAARAGADPLAGVERVVVDGSNLAHALAGRGRVPQPMAGVIAALRATFPADVRVEVVFDGPGRPSRAASNLFVAHAGKQPADRIIEAAVEAQLRADGPAGTWGILVVTDDRELRGLVQARGARVAGTTWLAGRLDRARAGIGPRPNERSSGQGERARSGTSIGHNRRPYRPDRSEER